ncbi:MAG: hypothetical protein HUJ22_07250 [Gracilimonas sp.]|uniref:WD40/YVTN/BNR-like repeat-containing protein n=1 Tax=Gracilimonas sp. TaxID=1974203 RepID=UPI0019B2642B|nr:hypothetical protein [Gracilimonas sp.]MBD3616353.1 hypothetical protein [Gracilimonas sp.]
MKHFQTLFAIFAVVLLSLFLIPDDLKAQNTSSATQIDTTLFNNMQFRPVGPTRGGRVTAVEGHQAHPYTFYMGAAGAGGVWRTTNYGSDWTNITDDADFKSTSIGAIEIAESDTNVIYVGTGSDGIRANVTIGRGIYKTTDAGETWKNLGLEEGGQIGAVKVHPEKPDLVYVAALGHPFGKNEQRGVFRSQNGGETWENVLFVSDSTGAIDLELNPENPDEIYAVMWRAERKPWTIISGADKENGLYKSTNGGDSWTKLENGLPGGLTGKMDLAVTPADPDRIYLLVEAPGDEQGLYRSNDRGESWEQTSNKEEIMSRPFYFTNITAHPKNPDMVYVGNVRYWVSTDGGETFERRPVTHADVHDLWINPDNPKIQVQGNDGGATVTLDGGKTWSTQLNQPTAELYQIHVDNQLPYWLYAGQQDNTTISVPSLPPAESAENAQGLWNMAGGCETGPAVPQPNNPSIVFSNCKGRFGQYSTITGQQRNYYVGAQNMYGQNPKNLKYRFQRVVPIEISPHDSSVVYNASQYIHRTTNGGQSWEQISPDLTAFKDQFQVASGTPITRDITGEEHYSTLYVVQVSPHNKDVIWTGANDGPVHVTTDGGENWTDVTPEGLPPNGRVDGIDPSPHTPGTAYVAVQRRLLDDFKPYIYRTTDFGKNWTLLTDGNGIPEDNPVRVVREDPNRKGMLYAGTDWGLYFSLDDGKQWQQLKQGLPQTTITDIKIKNEDLVVSTMGRSFWILDNLTPLYQYDIDMARVDQHLFEPRDTYRMRYRGGGGSDVPQFPEAGVMIDFYLSDISKEEITMDIMKEDGTVIRRFIGTSAADTNLTQLANDKPITESVAKIGEPDSINVEQGHNRFIWDMRHPGSTTLSSDGTTYFGPYRGPMVPPGDYQIRLSAGDWKEVKDFKLMMDPRLSFIGISEEDLLAQEELNLKIRDAIGQAKKVAAQIDTLRNELLIQENVDHSVSLDKVNELFSRLVTSEVGSYQKPVLIDQMEYLYRMTTSADQRPGDDAYERFDELNNRLQEILWGWDQMQNALESQ